MENAKMKKEAERKAAQYRDEAQSGGMDAAMSDEMKQEMIDRKAEAAAKKAPTTRSEMGKMFKAGGSVSGRADGCATKGKTRGKMV
jgi:hypothetical protein